MTLLSLTLQYQEVFAYLKQIRTDLYARVLSSSSLLLSRTSALQDIGNMSLFVLENHHCRNTLPKCESSGVTADYTTCFSHLCE
jgi:hypothetical protein